MGGIIPGALTNAAASTLNSVQNGLNNGLIGSETGAALQLAQKQQEQIFQDTQTKIAEIDQSIAVNMAKSQDQIFKKWDEFVTQA